MKDTSHLIVLQDRLSRENSRLSNASTENEKTFRQVTVDQAKREIEGEMKFLGMSIRTELKDISDDELLAELTA